MIVGLENLAKELINWYENSTTKAINVVSVPYRGLEPLTGLLERIAGDRRLLYITGASASDDSIEEFLDQRGIGWTTAEDPGAAVVILDFDGAMSLRDHYDLIIYDDLNTFPIHRKSEMQELLNHLYYKAGHIIAYSMEPVFRNVISLEIPLKSDRSFVTEPRFIDTRVDMRSGIPNSIYDYIKFFVLDDRHVLIFVPDHEAMAGMQKYLTRIDPDLAGRIQDVSGLTEAQVAERLAAAPGAQILFSLELWDYRSIPVNFEFIVSHSDDPHYEYRQFVFLCLRSGLYDDLNGEVILVSQTMSLDMERTKVLTRDFNRVLWENDQLFL